MEVQQDFNELLALFNKYKVDYVIVGAYALGYHGAPRYTGDLDILVKPDAVNSNKIMRALLEFGFGSVGLKAADFEQEGKALTIEISCGDGKVVAQIWRAMVGRIPLYLLDTNISANTRLIVVWFFQARAE